MENKDLITRETENFLRLSTTHDATLRDLRAEIEALRLIQEGSTILSGHDAGSGSPRTSISSQYHTESSLSPFSPFIRSTINMEEAKLKEIIEATVRSTLINVQGHLGGHVGRKADGSPSSSPSRIRHSSSSFSPTSTTNSRIKHNASSNFNATTSNMKSNAENSQQYEARILQLEQQLAERQAGEVLLQVRLQAAEADTAALREQVKALARCMAADQRSSLQALNSLIHTVAHVQEGPPPPPPAEQTQMQRSVRAPRGPPPS